MATALKMTIGAPVDSRRLAEQPISCMPQKTPKFTLDEWKKNNVMRERNNLDQQQLAESILVEGQRIIDETGEGSNEKKGTTDKFLKQRIGDVEFNKGELLIQRKEICDELEALSVYKTRLQDCLKSLRINALTICRKCLMLRDGRVGIDLVVDEVETALLRELTTIELGQSLLKRALEQLNEQMRRLRAVQYMLDRDLQYKQHAIDTDKSCLSAKPTDLSLSIYGGFANLDPAGISAEEYNTYSANNIKAAAREVTSARPIRTYVEHLLKQVIDDLWNAYHVCNEAFKQRIFQTKVAKERFENLHKETTEKIFAMTNNIVALKKALAEKEGNIGLAHTRLGKRAQRIEGELVRDPTGQALYYECEMLRYNTLQLQQMLMESSASLRYLLQAQLQLEEDINIKLNTLKIDEVDCMTLRATVDYNVY